MTDLYSLLACVNLQPDPTFKLRPTFETIPHPLAYNNQQFTTGTKITDNYNINPYNQNTTSLNHTTNTSAMFNNNPSLDTKLLYQQQPHTIPQIKINNELTTIEQIVQEKLRNKTNTNK
jgi:hypothetical protein